jgi:SAM-dependent methyltransferase
MATAARTRTGVRSVGVGDVAALPVRDGAADVALCMHVLYHLPDQAAGAAELRRVLRAGGTALVLTNSLDHVRELDELVADVAGHRPARAMYAFTTEHGAGVLRTAFDRVEAHLLRGALDVTDPDAVVGYVSSISGLYDLVEEARYAEVLDEVRARVTAAIERDDAFVVTTATGCFVCS